MFTARRGSLKWRSDYFKTHYLRSKSGIEFITCEELFAEDPNNMFGCGMPLWSGETRGDISVKLPAGILGFR